MKTQQQWKDAAASILDALTTEQAAQDHQRIEEITDTLRKSHLGCQILHWAEQHGVEIWMDHQCTGVGYYTVGSNTVCLNDKAPNDKLVMCLAHELRHAWQDHQGLLPSGVSTPQNYTAQIRFVEADAFGFGYVVGYEVLGKDALYNENSFLTSYYTHIIESVLDEDPYALENGEALCVAFHAYFNNVITKNQYDERCLGRCARDFNIANEDTADPLKTSFANIDFESPLQDGVNLHDPEDILRLGDIFGTSNYLRFTANMHLGHDPFYVGQFGPKAKLLLRQVKNQQKQQKKPSTKMGSP